MQNFETKLAATIKVLENIRGIFDKNRVESELKKIETTVLKHNFWKNKTLAKKLLNKKISSKKY